MPDTISFSIEQKQVSGVFYNNSHNGMIIYTEDSENEHDFYIKFYKRLLSGTEIIIDKVIQLGSCDEVVEACEADNDFSIPKLFIIDGDIYIMYSPKQEKNRLFVLDRYCIENYIIDEDTVCHAIQHFRTNNFEKIKDELKYDELLDNYILCMVNIYYYYALLSEENKNNRPTKTAGFKRQDYDSFFDLKNNKQRDVVVDKFISDSKQELLNLPNIDESYISKKLDNLRQKFPKTKKVFDCIVSGKDDIIPFLIKKAEKKFGITVPNMTTWKFNSVDYYNTSNAISLKNKIISVFEEYTASGTDKIINYLDPRVEVLS